MFQRMRTSSAILATIILCAGVRAAPATRPSRPVTVSKETTHATSPLRADGSVDYVGALNARMSQGVAPQDNAAVALLRALGPASLRMQPGVLAKVWPALGIEPLPPDGKYYVSPEDFAQRQDGPAAEALQEELDRVTKAVWTPEAFPAIAKWAASQEEAINRFADASRLPRYYFPLVSDAERSTTFAAAGNGFHGSRAACQALAHRARLRLGSGDFEGFRADALAVARLARLTTARPLLIDRLVSYGCDAVASDLFTYAATSELLPAAQSRTLMSDLEQLAPMPLVADAIDLGERYIMLDFVTLASKEGWLKAARMLGGRGAERMFFTGKENKDWDAVLRKLNGRYDRIVAAHTVAPYARRTAELRKVDEEMEQLRVRVTGPMGIFAPTEDRVFSLLGPVLGRAAGVHQQGVTRRDLARVALALSAYRAEHANTYPQSLAALVGAYLKSLPRDELAPAAPEFMYERNALGGYRLASVGANGQNDRNRLDENLTADDILVVGGKQPAPPKPMELDDGVDPAFEGVGTRE